MEMAGKRWTLNEIEVLKKYYPIASKDVLLKLIPGRSWNAIQLKAERLGLKRVRFTPEKSPELAYVLGLLIGDGTTCRYERKHDYVVRLINTNKEIINEFVKACTKMGFHVKVYERRPNPPGKKTIFYACFRSKAFTKWYLNIDVKYLEHFLKEDEVFNSFLRGLYEADGSLYWSSKRKILSIYNNNLELLKLIKEVLLKRGYKSVNVYHNKGKTYRLMIQGANEVSKFLSEVRPIVKNHIIDYMYARKVFASIRPRDDRGRFISTPKSLYSKLLEVIK